MMAIWDPTDNEDSVPTATVCPRVYVAASHAYAGRADTFAQKLQDFGLTPVSRWHGQVMIEDWTSVDEAMFSQALADNLSDLDRADVVVALTDIGYPRATIGEIGYALARGTPVVWVHAGDGRGRNLFSSHSLVTRIACVGDDEWLADRVAALVRRIVGEESAA